LVIGSFPVSCLWSQVEKHYQVENDGAYDLLKFTLNASTGSYKITPSHNSAPLAIRGTFPEKSGEPQFTTNLKNRTKNITLDLQDRNNADLSKTVSFNVFNDTKEQNSWLVNLSEEKPLSLQLNYGIGDADVDLSGIPIEKLKINTGSADVNVGYKENRPNKIVMDTFLVKVDLGSVNVDRIQLSKAKTVIAEVGFGELTLNFTEPSRISTDVIASVGAGSLDIIVPKNNMPAKIILNNSPLCRVKLADSFQKIEKNIYVNESYRKDAKNLVVFNLDVALGNITFKDQ